MAKASVLQKYFKNAKNVSFSLELNFNRWNLPINAIDHPIDAAELQARRWADLSYISTEYDPEGFALLSCLYTIIFNCSENSCHI
jgi:hypothetical protein